MAFNVTVIYLNGVKEYLRNIIKVTSEHGFLVLETSSGHVRKYDSRVKLEINMYGYQESSDFFQSFFLFRWFTVYTKISCTNLTRKVLTVFVL